jgi:hypothetical protein
MEYFWVWSAALVMVVLYPIMFLLMHGWVEATGPVQMNLELCSIGQPGVGQDLQRIEAERTKRVAKMMLLYVLIL